MSKYIKFLSLFLVALILVTCSSEENSGSDDGTTVDPESPIATSETIVVEDIEGLDYEPLSAKTFDDISEVDGDGTLEEAIVDDLNDDLPMIVLDGEDIVFGYYSKTGANGTVSIDDILLFYLTLNPGFGWLNLSNSELLAKIKASDNYEPLKTKLTEALNSSSSPLDDSSFNELLMQSSNGIYTSSIGDTGKNNSHKNGDIFNYQFSHSRGGTVTWEKKFPSFATVGLEITDNAGVVAGPYMLEKQGIVISPSSAIDWLWNYFTSTNTSTSSSFQLPQDGDYKITFTNGTNFASSSQWVGTEELERKVDQRNRIDIAVQTIQLVIPIGLKKLPPSCKSSLGKIFEDLLLEPVKLVIDQGDFNLPQFVSGLHDNTFEVVKNCVPDANIDYWKSFQKALKKLNFLGTAESVATLGFLIRDYVASDISGTEDRYYYGGYSYGKLTHTNVSGDYFTNGNVAQTEFSGEYRSEHTYKGIVSEKLSKYEIERDFKSTIKQVPSLSLADGIPFEAIITGDVVLNETSTIITNDYGDNTNLKIDFQMGEVDSTVDITAAFDGSGVGESSQIKLIPVNICDSNVGITNLNVNCVEPWYLARWEVDIEYEYSGSFSYTPQVVLQHTLKGEWISVSGLYSTRLISSSGNSGTFRITVDSPASRWNCEPTDENPKEHKWREDWRVALKTPECDNQSSWSSFNLIYYN